jgi:hypothetical protein
VSQSGFIALLIAAIEPIMALNHLFGIPTFLTLFAVGAEAAFISGLPPMKVDPQLTLGLFMPLIIYAATARISFHLLRASLSICFASR